MSQPELGRAVLEISTDSTKLDAGLAGMKAKVAGVGDSVKGLAGPLSQVNGLLGTFGAGLSIGAVVSFGKALLDTADQIVKVSDRTGLAYDEVQRLQFIAEQSGNSLDDLTGAVSKLQVRLADGAAKKGIEALGLNFEKIRNMRPADSLAAIASEIGKIENPTLRAQRAVEVFGKAGAEILPTLVANFKELGDAAPVMQDSTVAALDAAGDALGKFGSSIKVWAAESYNYARGLFDKLIAETYRFIARAYENAAGLAALIAKLPGADKLGVNPALVESLKTSSQWFTDAAGAMETNTVAAKKNAPAVALLPPIHEKASKATKDHADAIAKLTEQLSGGGAIKAASEMAEALRKLPPIQTLTKDAQLQIAKTMEDAIAVYAAAGKAIPRDLQLIAMAARAASATMSESAKAGIEAMQNAWGKISGVKLSALPFAIGFEDPTWATRETLKATRSFAAIVGQIDVAPIQAAAAKRVAGAFPPEFWTQCFGYVSDFGDRFADALTRAIESGEGLGEAAKRIAAQFATDFATDFLQGMLESVPVVGEFLGKFAKPIIAGIKRIYNAIFGTAGRDAVEEFAASFGGFDALHAQLLTSLQGVGEAFWVELTQQIGRGDQAGAAAVIARIQAALAGAPDALAAAAGYRTIAELEAIAKKAQDVYEYMLASGQYSAAELAKAFEASAAAQKAAMGDTAKAQEEALAAIDAKYKDSLDKLDGEFKSLSESVAKEADEAERGIVETRERARLVEIAAEKEALEAKKAAEIKNADETYDATLEAAKKAAAAAAKAGDEAFRDTFGKGYRIPITFTFPEGMPGGFGAGRITTPTAFLAGGSGASAFSRAALSGASSSRSFDITVISQLDGREVARNQARHLPNVLQGLGVSR